MALQITEGVILGTDPVGLLYTVQLVGSEAVLEGVGLYSPVVDAFGGGWSGGRPKKGSFVLLVSPSNTAAWYIMACRGLPRIEAAQGAAELESPLDEPRNDYRSGRATGEDGDVGHWGSQGNRVVVAANGVVEAVADEITYTRWFPDEHAIRTFALNVLQQGPWGTWEAWTDTDQEGVERLSTPTGVEQRYSKTSEGAPSVWVSAGTVQDETEVELPGLVRRNFEAPSSLSFRMLVFRQETADQFFDLGQRPDPALATYSFRVDEEGNVLQTASGAMTRTVESLTSEVRSREQRIVRGTATHYYDQDRVTRVAGASTETVGASKTLIVEGDLRIRCSRFRVEAANDDWNVDGPWVVRSKVSAGIYGSSKAFVRTSGDLTLGAGRSRADDVGGSFSMSVGGADVPPANLDRRSFDVKVKRGRKKVHVEGGSYELVIGPSASPVARIHISRDPRRPQMFGRLDIGLPRSRTFLSLFPSGAWSLRGPSGGIKGNALGQVRLGDMTTPVGGNVVTTASHPVCFITGLPILGHADVTIGAGGAIAPGVSPFVEGPTDRVFPPQFPLQEEP